MPGEPQVRFWPIWPSFTASFKGQSRRNFPAPSAKAYKMIGVRILRELVTPGLRSFLEKGILQPCVACFMSLFYLPSLMKNSSGQLSLRYLVYHKIMQTPVRIVRNSIRAFQNTPLVLYGFLITSKTSSYQHYFSYWPIWTLCVHLHQVCTVKPFHFA